MFISYILAAFTVAAAMGQQEPVLLSPHQDLSSCLVAKSRMKKEIEAQQLAEPIGLACLKIVWEDT